MEKARSSRTDANAKRVRAGIFSGILGIVCNTLLAGAKIAVGALFGMLSVLADGVNNLTDCGSNAVSLIGFKVSGKPADKEHPFGHRRAESVSALIVSVIVLAVAAELAVQSVQRIFAPEESDFSVALVIVLAASVAVKLGLFAFNFILARRMRSEVLKATALDSVTDCIATTTVLACLLISHYTGVALDGYAGVVVAAFIAFAGGSILKEAVSKLLGTAPDHETVRALQERIRAFDGVRGLHDLTVHSYGADKLYATVHVEVDSAMPIMAAHDLADAIEKAEEKATGTQLTVHIDPLVYGDERVDRLRAETEQAAARIDPRLHVHDFRVVGGSAHTNLVFEVAVPFDCALSEREITERLRADICAREANTDVVATAERQNIE